MAESNASATGGQAPAGDGANVGQAPQANNGGGTSSVPTTPHPDQASGGNTQQSSQQLSQADYERMIGELRKENAGHRTENARVAAELKKFQDAQLSDAEKQTKRMQELEQANTAQARELSELKLTRAIERTAAQLNIVSPDAAAKLLDWGEVEFDSSGAPKNLPKLLETLVQTYPFLVSGQGQAGQQQRPAASSGGATNPGASARAGGTFTREQINRMTPQEYAANRTAIMEQLKSGNLPH